MLDYANVVGNQEDWASFITGVEMLETPFIDWLPVDGQPIKSNIFDYLVEKYRAPRKNRHVDGVDFQNFTDPMQGNQRLKALIQWFDEGVSISRLAEDNTDIKAINDQLARGTLKKLKEMRRDAEVQFCSNDDCFEDNKEEGYATRGVGSWLNPSAQTLYPVHADYRPAAVVGSDPITAGQVITTTTANMATVSWEVAGNDGYEAMTTFILQQMWNVTKKAGDMIDCFCGDGYKSRINQAQFYIPGGTTAQTAVAWPGRDKELSRIIDVLKTDYGTVRLMLTPYLGAAAGVVPAIGRFQARFLHRDMWGLRWKVKPKVYELPFAGGSYKRAMEMIAMLYCKNPAGEGAYMPGS